MLAITSTIAALRASQSPQNQSVLALESTGRYHAQLALAAHAAGLRVYVLNPLDARRYAQSVGQRQDRSDGCAHAEPAISATNMRTCANGSRPPPAKLRCANSSPTGQRWCDSAVHWRGRATTAKNLRALTSRR